MVTRRVTASFLTSSRITTFLPFWLVIITYHFSSPNSDSNNPIQWTGPGSTPIRSFGSDKSSSAVKIGVDCSFQHLKFLSTFALYLWPFAFWPLACPARYEISETPLTYRANPLYTILFFSSIMTTGDNVKVKEAGFPSTARDNSV